MPRLFGRKLVCFYCNRRSAQDRKSGIRQWQCEQCEAVNHLDEVRLLGPCSVDILSLSSMARSQIHRHQLSKHLSIRAMSGPYHRHILQTQISTTARSFARDASRTSTS